MSLKFSRFRQLTSLGEIAGFLLAWIVGVWVATQASLHGEGRSQPSDLAAAEVARPAAAIK